MKALDDLKNINLNKVQKRALFKIAVDMVKIDNRIHRNEVSVLDTLQHICRIDNEELELIHYTSLQRAIAAMQSLDRDSLFVVIQTIEAIVGIDNDIDFKENLLLTALKMALSKESSSWCSIISVAGVDSECSQNQIVYLERNNCENAHIVLDDKYDNLLMNKALDDVDLQLFYLPNVLNELSRQFDGNSSQLDLLRRSMDFIVPAGDQTKLNNLNNVLNTIDSSSFYKIVSSYYNISPDQIRFDAFFMVKLQEGQILDDDNHIQRTIDFFIIDASDDVKKRILTMVDMMESPTCLLSYEGYYRLLYDHICSESKIMSNIILDGRYEFRLKDLDFTPIVMESSPQSRSFYILLLWYGQTGINQHCFDEASKYLESLDISACQNLKEFKEQLINENLPHCTLIYNVVTIYEEVSGKDAASNNYALYASKIIKHRSALKNYINKGFSKITRLSNTTQYLVDFNSNTRCYYIPLNLSYVEMTTPDGVHKPFSTSDLWKKLK